MWFRPVILSRACEGVYDVDNIVVLIPDRHINTHKGRGMSALISEMTEAEFLIFLRKIYNDEYETEEDHINAILEFERLVEHPAGSDLIFYPEPGKGGVDAVVKEVKEWRAASRKTSFKVS